MLLQNSVERHLEACGPHPNVLSGMDKFLPSVDDCPINLHKLKTFQYEQIVSSGWAGVLADGRSLLGIFCVADVWLRNRCH